MMKLLTTRKRKNDKRKSENLKFLHELLQISPLKENKVLAVFWRIYMAKSLLGNPQSFA